VTILKDTFPRCCLGILNFCRLSHQFNDLLLGRFVAEIIALVLGKKIAHLKSPEKVLFVMSSLYIIGRRSQQHLAKLKEKRKEILNRRKLLWRKDLRRRRQPRRRKSLGRKDLEYSKIF
jgi:hypothetical protein